jgi:gliding motility-associated-like protein
VVTFKPNPTVIVNVPANLCTGINPIQLVSNPTTGSWQGQNVSSTGLYTVPTTAQINVLTYNVTGTNGCTTSESRTIQVTKTPIVSLGPDRNVCKNGIDFIGMVNDLGVSYRWNTGQTTSTIFPPQSGSYTLTAVNGICANSDNINITLLPSPYIPLKDEFALCVPENLPIKLDATVGPGISYKWLPSGQTNSFIYVSSVGTYTVEATNTLGCTSVATTNVVDRCEPSILVPTIFTPNNDNLNNTFQVFTAHIIDYELKIYNRWGELVFVSTDKEVHWDGKYKGVLVKPDSFAWEITYKAEYFPDRGTLKKQGAVTVAW